MQNSQIRKKGCFLTLTRILDCKAPGLPASSTSELAREGNALNSTCFDLDEAFDTASHTITMAKSTETYMATRTTQELSRLDRKTSPSRSRSGNAQGEPGTSYHNQIAKKLSRLM